MSNIYIQEPPTDGKVLLETTIGDIDIELWSREAPKACRNFVQLCLEGYYNGTVFHRVIRDFIAQGGDPTGTGMGGESIYGAPFKDEFHSRLRFVRRGLVAMANAGKDDNGSQFFFTMGSCPELQNKHTIFGKVAGDTLYNMLRLQEGLITDSNDRPKYPHKITNTKVLSNPYTDIVPRNLVAVDDKSTKKEKPKQTKNFKLLSFGDEAEEDDDATDSIAKDFRGKSKSSHDLANDPKLSSVPAVEGTATDEQGESQIEAVVSKEEEEKSALRVATVQKKLKSKAELQNKRAPKRELAESDDDGLDEAPLKKKAQVDEIRKEIRKLKKELAGKSEVKEIIEEQPTVEDEAVREYHESLKTFQEKKKNFQTTKESNEERTLAMMAKFRERLSSAQDNHSEKEKEKETIDDDDDDEDGWLTHKLTFEDDIRMARDANIRDADAFEIYDPRNPINQRRREASKLAMSVKKSK